MPEDERPIVVHLHDTVTGERGTYQTTGWWEGAHFQDFIWSEGNFSCDCNRRLFLYRDVLGRDMGSEDVACSDGEVRVRIEDEAGAHLFSDEGA